MKTKATSEKPGPDSATSGSPTSRSSRRKAARRRLRGWVVWVAILAAVILIGAWLAPWSEPSDEPVFGPSNYEQALDKLREGEIDAAVGLLNAQLALDPTDEQSKSLLEIIRRHQSITDVSNGSDPGDSDPGDDPEPPDENDDVWLEPVDDFYDLMPVEIPGYLKGSVQQDAGDAVLPFDPIGEPETTYFRRVLFSVHDLGTRKAAEDFVAAYGSQVFPRDGRNVTVGGRPGRAGTDGSRYCAIAFSRGRFAFEIVGTTLGPPASMISRCRTLAGYFPAAKN